MILSSGFYYNQEYSGNKGVIKIRTEGGFLTDSFLATVNNQVVKNKNSNKSFLEESDEEPIVIPMALYFNENIDETSLRGVKRWLNQKDFKELVFEDDPNKVYYAKPNGQIALNHNTNSSGYVEFEFLTNSAYSFSRMIEIEGESISDTEFHSLSIYNEGDKTTFPKMKIIMNPNTPTNIEIFNDTTGQHFLLENNLVNETVIVWNEYEELETSSNLKHRYDDHNDEFIKFAEGTNDLRIKGKFVYTIEYSNIYL